MLRTTRQPVAVADEQDDVPLQRLENAMPVALWQTRFKVYEECDRAQCTDGDTCDREGEAPSQQAEKRNFAIGHELIAGAYVVCVPASDPLATQSMPPRYEDVIFARTNDAGWIVRCSREAVGAESEVPKAIGGPAEVMEGWPLRARPAPARKVSSPARDRAAFLAPSGSSWRIFWTYKKEHFERFCDALQTDLNSALNEWEVPEYTLLPAALPRDRPELRLLPKGSLRSRYVDYFLLRGNERRFLSAFRKIETAQGKQADGEKTVAAAILNATPHRFWALYYCEWLTWYTERVIQDDARWPYLWRLLSVIAAAESGAPFPDLEKALPAGGPVGEAAQAMREYLHECVRAGWRGRDEVRRVVHHITVSHTAWRSDAEEIFQATGIRHPALQERNLDRFSFSEEAAGALLAYYDMYALGFDRAGDAEPLREHWQHVQRALGWVRDQQQALLSRVDPLAILRDLDLYLPPAERDARLALAHRYQEQCACLGIAFWEQAEIALQPEDAWKKLRPYLAWLGETTDLVALLFEKLLAHYIKVYQLPARSVEALVNYLFRFHTDLRSSGASHTLPQARGVVRVTYEADKGLARAEFWVGQKRKLLAEFELLTEVALPEWLPRGSPGTRTQRKQLRRALKVLGKRSFVLTERALDVPHAEALEGFGKQLAEVGALLRASIVLKSLIEELKQKPPEDVSLDAYLAVAEETFQGLGPTSKLAEYVLRKRGASAVEAAGHPFVRGASRLVALGDVVEAARNIAAGSQTVFSLLDPHRSTSNLGLYLSRGETAAVWLEGTKGLVQVATGGAGVLGSIVLGMGTTVAALPLGTWVVLGSVAITTLDVLVYLKSGGQSPVDGFLEKVKDARSKEFLLDHEGGIRRPDEPSPEPRAETRYGAPARPTSALSKHLGGLHALLQGHLGGVAPGKA